MSNKKAGKETLVNRSVAYRPGTSRALNAYLLYRIWPKTFNRSPLRSSDIITRNYTPVTFRSFSSTPLFNARASNEKNEGLNKQLKINEITYSFPSGLFDPEVKRPNVKFENGISEYHDAASQHKNEIYIGKTINTLDLVLLLQSSKLLISRCFIE